MDWVANAALTLLDIKYIDLVVTKTRHYRLAGLRVLQAQKVFLLEEISKNSHILRGSNMLALLGG